MCARLVAGAIAALALTPPVEAAPARAMRVSVRVVRSISVRMPGSLAPSPAGAPASGRPAGLEGAARLGASSGGRRAMGVFAGAPGGSARSCPEAACLPGLARAGTGPTGDRSIVVTFLPDGAPAGIRER